MSGKFDMVKCDQYRAACEAGADFFRAMVLKDECTGAVRDLTGYTAKLQVKTASGGTLILTPTCTVNGPTGTVSASATAAVTALLTPGRYAYDWIIGKVPTLPATAWTDVERVLEGKFDVTARITVA